MGRYVASVDERGVAVVVEFLPMSSQFHASAQPLPAGWIDGIWRATQAGALTWTEAQHLQDIALPRCLKHDEPIKATDHGGQCLKCIEEMVGVSRDS